ncbi:serine/threonine-protein kinase KIN4 [Aspergillus udagawae]|uniref:EKC/KEOPS complex subunit BUD32 n=1 Tax=Aspergillus udagawae TaxID=91492 RepID=A0ABQ1A1K8_9EURO|nr:serine/threonine-protein kinase KIN4 [Aspergillus udagawae]GFF71382.1 serine/threonine-protein kinase KIN4 [Aspergillus udagawae]GFG22088.1 serine/threonine-protein kinase KIN4 [Aspergillus udagawae]
MSDSNNTPKEAAANSSGPRFGSYTPQKDARSYVNNSPVFNPDDSGTDRTNETSGTNANNATNTNNATNPTVAPNATAYSDTTDSDGAGPTDDVGIDLQSMPGDTRRFDKIIPLLIQPESAVSERFPLLHRVIAGRLKTSLDLRGGRRVSRCSHKYGLGASTLNQTKKHRPDSHAFQMRVASFIQRSRAGHATVNARLKGMCQRLRRKVRLSGCIGSGGFGTVFLAHKNTPHGQANFAIKVHEHNTIATMEDGLHGTEMMFFEEGGKVRYIPCEAMIMLLLTRSPRFPTLHSVYTEKDKVAIVMSACMDYDTLQLSKGMKETDKVWAVEGSHLRTPEKEPRLNELQACKVSTQLLEAIAYLRDMNITYDDLSYRNYLVGENLDTQLIDFGIMGFGLDDLDFMENSHTYVFWQEYQLPPEVAIELLKPQLREHIRNKTHGIAQVKCRKDTRQAALWNYAVEVFCLLHGYAPWEDPEWDDQIRTVGEFAFKLIDGRWQEPPELHDEGPRWDAAYARRKRMINEELAIREDLSQDCVDALRTMLQRDPKQRPRLSELISLPWFGQWAYHDDRLFERPDIPRECFF